MINIQKGLVIELAKHKLVHLFEHIFAFSSWWYLLSRLMTFLKLGSFFLINKHVSSLTLKLSQQTNMERFQNIIKSQFVSYFNPKTTGEMEGGRRGGNLTPSSVVFRKVYLIVYLIKRG